MKKKFINLILVVFSFFFFSCFRVYAQDFYTLNLRLNFDLNEHFNYFYEFQHNTPFYQFILGNSSNFSNYLKSFYSDGYDVFFAYSNDLDSNLESHIPADSHYVIIMTNHNTHCYLRYSSDNYSYYCPSTSSFNEVHYLFYDYNANYLGGYNYSYNSSLHLNFTTSHFTYILGSYYGNLYNNFSSALNWRSNSTTFDIRVTAVQVNNNVYSIKDLDTLSGFSSFKYDIANFFGSIFLDNLDSVNLNDFGLSYFTKNFVIKSGTLSAMTSIYQAFSYSDTFNYSVIVPNGYSSQTFNYNERYFLIPNSTTCSNAEMLLYFNTSDKSTINFISYDLLQDELQVDNMKTYSFQLKNANSIEALSLHSVVGSYESITDNFYLVSSSDNFSTNTLYYNPSCFSTYSAIDNNNLTFTNVNTGNEVVVTPAEKQLIIYNSNETIDNIISTESDLNLSDIISGAWSGAKTFVSASYFILTMSTSLFTSLPNEVKGILLCVFSVGMIVILWKVFRS